MSHPTNLQNLPLPRAKKVVHCTSAAGAVLILLEVVLIMISSSLNCNSSGVVCLLGCKARGKQCVGSTVTSFRTRFNNYESSSRKFSYGMSIAQAELFRYFTEVNGFQGRI